MHKLRRLFSIPVKQNQELGMLRRELAIERLRAMDLHAFVDAWLTQAHDSAQLQHAFDVRLQRLIDAQWSALQAQVAGARRVRPLARREPRAREENSDTEDVDLHEYPMSRWQIEFDC